jgi:hypothetical protein
LPEIDGGSGFNFLAIFNLKKLIMTYSKDFYEKGA